MPTLVLLILAACPINETAPLRQQCDMARVCLIQECLHAFDGDMDRAVMKCDLMQAGIRELDHMCHVYAAPVTTH